MLWRYVHKNWKHSLKSYQAAVVKSPQSLSLDVTTEPLPGEVDITIYRPRKRHCKEPVFTVRGRYHEMSTSRTHQRWLSQYTGGWLANQSAFDMGVMEQHVILHGSILHSCAIFAANHIIYADSKLWLCWYRLHVISIEKNKRSIDIMGHMLYRL